MTEPDQTIASYPHLERQTRILFVHYGDDWIRGSERCLLDLLATLDKQRYHPLLWCNSPVLAAAAEQINIETHCQPMSLLLSDRVPRFDTSGFYRQVRQGVALVKKHKIDLIHANSGAPCQWLNWVARACHLPLLTHLHSRYPLWQRWLFGLHQVDLAVGVSHPVIEQLREDGMAEERLAVVANGIDIQSLSRQQVVNVRCMLNLPPETLVIAAVGSLIYRKGFDIAIAACAELVKKGVDFHLVIIGEGEQRAELEQKITALKLNRRVTLLGECSGVVGFLKGGCDVLLSTAREEVFGLVLLEAALARVPVLAPSVGGIPEVIVDRQTGLLHQAGNVKQLTEQLIELISEPQLRSQLADAGYASLQAQFSIQHNVSALTACYDRLTAGSLVRVSRRGTSRWNLVRSLARSRFWHKCWGKSSAVTD